MKCKCYYYLLTSLCTALLETSVTKGFTETRNKKNKVGGNYKKDLHLNSDGTGKTSKCK